jgi:hypothetical protein
VDSPLYTNDGKYDPQLTRRKNHGSFDKKPGKKSENKEERIEIRKTGRRTKRPSSPFLNRQPSYSFGTVMTPTTKKDIGL